MKFLIPAFSINRFRRIICSKNNVLQKISIPLRYIHNTVLTCKEIDYHEPHKPVLLNEVLQSLVLKENGVYLDMTFGAGGHSRQILENNSSITLYSLDRDPTTKTYAADLQKLYPTRFHPMIGKFSELPKLLKEKCVNSNTFSGVLMDLGVSSMQFNTPERGFMLSQDGPLDMRMDKDRFPDGITAADVLNHIEEDSLKRVLKYYGGEKRAKKIARGIVDARLLFKRFNSTKELAQFIATIVGDNVETDSLNRFSHPATKTFQALRIFVNDELNELDFGMRAAHHYLELGGRLSVLSFHSLEDTIAKRHFQGVYLDFTPDTIGRPSWKIHGKSPLATYTMEQVEDHFPKLWKPLYKHVVVPSKQEMISNPRSRSAKLRSATKLKCL